MKKVLQNGFVVVVEPSQVTKSCKTKITLTCNEITTVIDFIHFNALNALKFPKIVKNYYGAPPPPEPRATRADVFLSLPK